ncbi:MAG: hypothetical protein ACI4RD_02230, partial [Kiritimatiellia bacterium]
IVCRTTSLRSLRSLRPNKQTKKKNGWHVEACPRLFVFFAAKNTRLARGSASTPLCVLCGVPFPLFETAPRDIATFPLRQMWAENLGNKWMNVFKL